MSERDHEAWCSRAGGNPDDCPTCTKTALLTRRTLIEQLATVTRERDEAVARYDKRHAQCIEALDNGDRFAEERDAALTRAENAERERDEARAELARWKGTGEPHAGRLDPGFRVAAKR